MVTSCRYHCAGLQWLTSLLLCGVFFGSRLVQKIAKLVRIVKSEEMASKVKFIMFSSKKRDLGRNPFCFDSSRAIWALLILAALPEITSESEVTQSCPTLCVPMDCSLSGSSVHGIFQARVLEWIAISFSRGSSRPRNRTQVSRIAGRHFTV